jgi:hypothetical protein
MDAAQLYSSTLELLNATLLKMLSPEWDAKVQAASAEVRRQALVKLLQVQHARLVLGNAVLQDISQQLKSNEQGLLDGQKNLSDALASLASVESVLNTVGSLISVVARIVPLL